MNLPTAALNTQLTLMNWVKTQLGKDYLQSYYQSLVDDRVFSTVGGYPRFEEVIYKGLNYSETYGVTAEIGEVIETASTTIPDYALRPSDLPSKSGFVFYEKPIIVPDAKNRPLAVRATMWGQAVVDIDGSQKGIVIFLFTDLYDKRDYYAEEWARLESQPDCPHHAL